MSQRPVSYAGKRIAPSRRSAPPRKAPVSPRAPPGPDEVRCGARSRRSAAVWSSW